MQVPNSLCDIQVHYQYIINIKLVPRRSFGNLAKSNVRFQHSQLTMDLNFQLTFLLNLHLPGAKIHVTKRQEAYGV